MKMEFTQLLYFYEVISFFLSLIAIVYFFRKITKSKIKKQDIMIFFILILLFWILSNYNFKILSNSEEFSFIIQNICEYSLFYEKIFYYKNSICTNMLFSQPHSPFFSSILTFPFIALKISPNLKLIVRIALIFSATSFALLYLIFRKYANVILSLIFTLTLYFSPLFNNHIFAIDKEPIIAFYLSLSLFILTYIKRFTTLDWLFFSFMINSFMDSMRALIFVILIAIVVLYFQQKIEKQQRKFLINLFTLILIPSLTMIFKVYVVSKFISSENNPVPLIIKALAMIKFFFYPIKELFPNTVIYNIHYSNINLLISKLIILIFSLIFVITLVCIILLSKSTKKFLKLTYLIFERNSNLVFIFLYFVFFFLAVHLLNTPYNAVLGKYVIFPHLLNRLYFSLSLFFILFFLITINYLSKFKCVRKIKKYFLATLVFVMIIIDLVSLNLMIKKKMKESGMSWQDIKVQYEQINKIISNVSNVILLSNPPDWIPIGIYFYNNELRKKVIMKNDYDSNNKNNSVALIVNKQQLSKINKSLFKNKLYLNDEFIIIK